MQHCVAEVASLTEPGLLFWKELLFWDNVIVSEVGSPTSRPAEGRHPPSALLDTSCAKVFEGMSAGHWCSPNALL